jgi:SAM-dependent methyltransferase
MGRRGQLTPPKGLSRFIGEGDFKEVGENYVEFLRNLGGLRATDRLLDVGCGIGRMAVPLTTYLEKDAVYEGFDIVAEGIKWCKKAITSRYPNFRFTLADIYNRQYNPNGTLHASEYRFPYDDEYFDLVFLGSVFTHMLPRDMEHYVKEIGRVLKKGGLCFVTFFLINEESSYLMSSGASSFDFCFEFEGFITIDDAVPERAVAYDERYVRNLFERADLNVTEPIHYGSWCGRTRYYSGQDIVKARKNG